MERVGIRELRQNLSRYLDRVKEGESLEVTEHGRIVARLSPSGAAAGLPGYEELAARYGTTIPTHTFREIAAARPRHGDRFPPETADDDLADSRRERIG
jgi:prevent-host-death family protein